MAARGRLCLFARFTLTPLLALALLWPSRDSPIGRGAAAISSPLATSRQEHPFQHAVSESIHASWHHRSLQADAPAQSQDQAALQPPNGVIRLGRPHGSGNVPGLPWGVYKSRPMGRQLQETEAGRTPTKVRQEVAATADERDQDSLLENPEVKSTSSSSVSSGDALLPSGLPGQEDLGTGTGPQSHPQSHVASTQETRSTDLTTAPLAASGTDEPAVARPAADEDLRDGSAPALPDTETPLSAGGIPETQTPVHAGGIPEALLPRRHRHRGSLGYLPAAAGRSGVPGSVSQLGQPISSSGLTLLSLPAHQQHARVHPISSRGSRGDRTGAPLNGTQGSWAQTGDVMHQAQALLCPVQACPVMTPCGPGSSRGTPGEEGPGEASIGSCWNHELEDKPVRLRPPVLWSFPGSFHPWSMTANWLNACLKNVTGADGDVVRPGCPWAGDRWGGEEGAGKVPGRRWRDGWAGQVFVLKDVFLDSGGHVFNLSHRFYPGGCWDGQEFTHAPDTAVVHVDEAANLMAAPLLPPTARTVDLPLPLERAHLRRATSKGEELRALAHELPLLVPVLKALANESTAVLASTNPRLHLTISKRLLLLGTRLPRASAPVPKQLWRVGRLLQPVFQPCNLPSSSLWRRLRAEHLLPPPVEAAPAAAATEAPSSDLQELPLIPPSAPLIPKDWLVVLDQRTLDALANVSQILGLVGQFFPPERVEVATYSMGIQEVKALLNRAVLYITSPHKSAASVVFMPPNSTVLLLRPHAHPSAGQEEGEEAAGQGSPSEGEEKETGDAGEGTGGRMELLEADSQLAEALAEACEVRAYTVFCAGGEASAAREEGASGGSTTTTPLACDSTALAEVIDRSSHDAYTAHAPSRVIRPSVNESTESLPPGKKQQENAFWFNQTSGQVAQYAAWAECVSTRGRWVLDRQPRLLPWEYTGSINLCDHRFLLKGGLVSKAANNVSLSGGPPGDWRVRRSLKYIWWTPKGRCGVHPLVPGRASSFAEFSGFQFCRLVGQGRTFLFLGDSLQDQMTAVFLNNMLKEVRKPADWALNESIPQECIDWLPPGGMVPHLFCRDIRFHADVCPGMRLIFVRTDFLLLQNPRAFDRMQFSRFAFLADVDIAVINRGAHFEPTEKFRRDLHTFLRYSRNRFPRMLVVYRNTPPGHKDCENATRPLTHRQDPSSLPFNWGQFQEQNALAKELVESHDYVYMDVDTMTALRIDGHKGRREDNITDCLHYCTPGPLDLWPQHLYNTLVWVAPLPKAS